MLFYKEGDKSLTDPKLPDLHPIPFWNLLYFFHRYLVGIIGERGAWDPRRLCLLDSGSFSVQDAAHSKFTW